MTIHKMEPGGLDSGDILLQTKMPLTEATVLGEINSCAEKKLPAMFVDAVAGLADGTVVARPQSETGKTPFRCYPRLPRDGIINWSRSAAEIHALVRAEAKPYSGAYTYYRDRDDVLQKLFVWDSWVVSQETPDIGVPGHVLVNDRKTGESFVMTGDGVLAIKSASLGPDGDLFLPGRQWRSIRMRLGMDIEDEIYRLIVIGV